MALPPTFTSCADRPAPFHFGASATVRRHQATQADNERTGEKADISPSWGAVIPRWECVTLCQRGFLGQSETRFAVLVTV